MRKIGHIFLSFWMAFFPVGIEAASRKITKPDLPWVDAPGIWSDPNGKNSGDGSGSDANGKGSKNGSGSGAGRGGTEFTKPGTYGGAGKGGPGDDDKKGGGSSSPGGSISKKLPYYYPMCLFIDSDKPASEGNQTVKAMVDEIAQKCDVALIVFPFTLAHDSYNGEDDGFINERQAKMCNIPQAGIAPAASASTCSWGQHADNRMCGEEGPPREPWTGIAGCAEVRAAKGVKPADPVFINPGDEADYKRKQESHTGNATGGGGVAVSIEDNRSCSAEIVAHEAIGHSQMGSPNGESHGHGIGPTLKDGHTSDGWTAAGCEQMRKNAFDNDGRWTWDPNRTTYYVKPPNPANWKRFDNPEPIFKVPNVASKGGGSPAGPAIVGSDRLTMVDGKPKTKASEIEKLEKKGMVVEDGEEDRHRRKNRTQLFSRVSGEAPDEEEELKGVRAKPAPPGDNGPVKPRSTITYDESAPKRMSGSGGGGVATAEPAPADIYSGTSSDVPGDTRSYNVGGGSSPSEIGPIRGATLTYDESAPKGANGTGLASTTGATVGRDPAADGGASADPQVRSVVRVGAAGSSLSGEEFFEEDEGEDGEKADRKKRLRRGKQNLADPNTLRSRSRTGPRVLSGGSPETIDQTSPED